MSQTDEEDVILSETATGQSDGDNLKLVPVTESIRYRKRAQSAEKRSEILAEQLARAKSESTEMAEQLRNVQVEQELTRKLVAAGTVDLEAAVLLAKAKLEARDDGDLESVIEEMQKEKQYLFAGSSAVKTSQRTAGAKDRIQNSQAILERAAKKAATTGNRTDLQEYLKLRRNFV